MPPKHGRKPILNECIIVENMPIAGLSMLLGNDLAGELISSCSTISCLPADDATVKARPADDATGIVREPLGLVPACAVTRSAARGKNKHINDTTSVEIDCEARTSQVEPMVVELALQDPMTRSKLIEEQSNDPELVDLFKQVVSESTANNCQICFYLKSGVLMRKFRPADAPANHDWLVILKCFRKNF